MSFIADLHIHSRYSRATSPELCFEQLYAWGRKKGIAVVGTGDCTHPGWLAEITEKLLPAGDGVFCLRDELRPKEALPAAAAEVRFLITGEVSTIYKADGATRKVHHLLCLPDIAAAERFAARLERIGNIASDGRPILGLDSRDLLETLLEVSPDAVLIPAHIWTPWFSALGSKSGFDSIAACYRDLADHIFAVETGLSSDPPMNWRVSGLDRYTLVSNSDAHSPAKLGREANVFTCEPGYTAIMQALRRAAPGYWGTLEFFPEEGKYHFDGHRKCNFSCAPEESRALHGKCPVCGSPLTLGVEYRVVELADRPRGAMPAGAGKYQSLLSLAEIGGQVLESSATSKKAVQLYDKLLAEVGPELFVLREAELDAIKAAGGELLAQAVAKMRAGRVHATPGYDGEFGVINIFSEEERAEVLGQIQLFAGLAPAEKKRPVARVQETAPAYTPAPESVSSGLSEEQQRAVQAPPAPLVIVAGPGAGKTRTLVERINWLVSEHGIDPTTILALTFSNRAARELAERLDVRLPGSPTVATFHKLGFSIVSAHRELLGLPPTLRILAEEEAEEAFAACAPVAEIATLDELECAFTALYTGAGGDLRALREVAEQVLQLAPEYAAAKRALGALDFTDLLMLPLALLAEHEALREQYRQRWPHVFVDEYQDVNVLQYLLLRLLCPPGGDLCVIGDPDQAIYGFRGADVRYFLRFREDYPGAVQIALTRNYRSSRAIVQASTQVIACGSLLGERKLWSDRSGPPQVQVVTLPTPAAEAEYAVQTIEALLGGISHFSVDSGRSGDGVGNNLGFNDIAVLYRTHAIGAELQLALERSGIPYQRSARQDIFRRPDVRRVLAQLTEDTNNSAISIDPEVFEGRSPQSAILGACLAHGIPESALQEAPWTLLLQRAQLAEDLPAFLHGINLERDIDLYDPRAARVALMTVHAAKGLEWEVVFLIGCEEGSFPHPAAAEEEERRLFYVGMTRARTHLYLTHAAARQHHGERTLRRPSPFLGDISPELAHYTTPYADKPKRARQLTMELFGE